MSSRQTALTGGAHGAAFVSGSPDKSLLLQRIERGEMPPSGRLPASEVESLRGWIAAGAPWTTALEEHRATADWWSLQPLGKTTPPQLDQVPAEWTRSPIDAFVIAKLRRKGLNPSPPAGRRELIRRITFDLTGLPPTPEEIDAFVNDRSPSAYENLVDRLLSSPHYGEQWGRHWLDVARFSESEGFERDQMREYSWRYRDYVIRSLNEDKPYIEFAREQIAGDVLAPVTHDSIIATGFLVGGPTDAVGLTSAVTRERETVREDQLEEMVSVVSQSFLGLTANCARCHDHKFDPIPQKDYYRFKAAFAGVWQPVKDRESIDLFPDGRPLRTPEEEQRLDAETSRLRNRLDAIESEVSALYRGARGRILEQRGYTWPASVPKPISQWTFDTDMRDQIGNAHVVLAKKARIGDGHLKPVDGVEGMSVYTSKLDRSVKEKTLEAWLWVRKPPQRGTSILQILNRSGYRGAAVDGIRYLAGQKRQWTNESTAGFRTAELNGPEESSAPGDRIHMAIAYAADGTIQVYRNAVPYGPLFHPEAGDASSGLQTYFAHDALVQLTANQSLELDEARLYDVALSAAQIKTSYAAGAPSVLADECESAMTAADRERLHQRLHEISDLQKQLAAVPQPEKVFAPEVIEAGVTHVLRRGDVENKAEAVAPAGLSAIRGLSPDFGLPPDAPDRERRRKMAEWIANPANPLFSRVIVNRVWHYHFGNGIVDTPNDFGYNGSAPSHPELLDYLAGEFIKSGWSLKKLHKAIVLSAAYRQSSEWNTQAAGIDADNRLLWRYSARRLDGESIRDAMLSVSGLLNAQMGGPSFRPFTATTPGGSYVKYEQRDSDEPDLQRRTVYRMNVTTGGDPMLDALDCPVPSVKTPKRAFTTTPLQALSLMNGAFANRMAKAFAARVQREAKGVDAQITRAFELAFGRAPSAEELASGRKLVQDAQLETLTWGVLNASEFSQIE